MYNLKIPQFGRILSPECIVSSRLSFLGLGIPRLHVAQSEKLLSASVVFRDLLRWHIKHWNSDKSFSKLLIWLKDFIHAYSILYRMPD